MAGSVQTNSGVVSRLFVQEKAGSPMYYVGCVGLRGLIIDPRQIEFTRCVGPAGVEISTIQRYPNPTPFDVTFGQNFKEWQSLFTALKRGCKPNFFLASARCEDSTKITDPTYYELGTWVYGVDANSGYQVHNNTAITLDPNTAVQREDQISFIYTEGVMIGANSYSRIGSVAAPGVKSIAIVDNGRCAETVCRPCDAAGCLQVLVNVGTDYHYSVDGGQTFTLIASSGAGKAQAFSGNAFMVNATAIKISSDVSLALASWTSATTDVTFAGLGSIAQIDARTLIVGGSEGAVWRSTNGGGNWTRIRTAVTGSADFLAMAYNQEMNMVVGLQKLGTSYYISVSTDRGKNWSTLTPVVSGKTYGANSGYYVMVAGPNTYVLIDGDLYKITCSGTTTSYSKLTLIGASTKITGIGMVNPKNPNTLLITTGDVADVGKIFVTNDGFDTVRQETLPISITTDDTVWNPVASCHSRYGDSLVIAFANTIYEAKDWSSFFAS